MTPEIETDTGYIKANLKDRRRVILTYPDGHTESLKVLPVQKRISDTEIMALTVMRLVIPLVAPEETTGMDQDLYLVEMEEGVQNLPQGKEINYLSALKWAGAILQANGWESQTVAELLTNEYLKSLKVSVGLGTELIETLAIQTARIRRGVVQFYPGAAAAIERKRTKKTPEW